MVWLKVNDGKPNGDVTMPFLTLAEDLEEEFGAGLGKRHIAEFVDDKQFDGGELRLQFEETPFVAHFHQLMNEPGRREEPGSRAGKRPGRAPDRHASCPCRNYPEGVVTLASFTCQ